MTKEKKKSVHAIKWLSKPEEHDYPAALSYLELLVSNNEATKIVERLKDQPIEWFKAKDIFRASELSLLGVSNSHVAKNEKKIKKDIALSPLLLVRNHYCFELDNEEDEIFDVDTQKDLIIADGYHRLCAVYQYDEDAEIPCQIV